MINTMIGNKTYRRMEVSEDTEVILDGQRMLLEKGDKISIRVNPRAAIILV